VGQPFQAAAGLLPGAGRLESRLRAKLPAPRGCHSNTRTSIKVGDILGRLDAAKTPQALNLPGYRLHQLKGNLKGLWAVTVLANWRIIFRFEGDDAFDVELIDYH
jgi:toxin HigB-1